MFTFRSKYFLPHLRKFDAAKLYSKYHRPYSTVNQIPLAPGYKPQDVESEIRQASAPTNSQSSKPNTNTFRMILPPPNVTGYLHLGHAFMSTIQDVICRRKRQDGYEVTWVPGTDHAGIATQVVVEKKLLKEKQQTRHQIGRDKFLAEVRKWKDDKEDNITRDLKRLGCTLDWKHEYFTMDEQRNNAVTEAFIRLFDDGIIQRKNSLVNWSCVLESAISDIEVNNQEINAPTKIHVPGYSKPITFGEIHDITYRIKDSNRTISVSTTRPETILGDVAIAVHPDDPRYTDFHKDSLCAIHPFRNETIPIVFDTSVDRDFGTGAVKITPAHDKADFDLAKRHNLPTVQVFTEKGTITENFSEFTNQPRFIARENIINALKSMGLYNGVKSHKMLLPICSRSNDIIEYMLRPQWFVDCKDMSEKAMDAVKSGKIKIHPQNFETEWFRWLEGCKEWCISRQIWWGHQIPAYFCQANETSAWVAAKSLDEAKQKAAKVLQVDQTQINATQDADVLDTWFSSSLLPLSAFGWPREQCKPLDLMETGHDILFFWVARMVMMGMKLTDDVPFTNVLLNGIVCDVHGRKMSKSLGNVILPEQVISGASFEELKSEIEKSYNNGTLSKTEVEKSLRGLQQTFAQGIPECGTDALRFTLCSYNIKSHFINFDVSECYANKLFFNKIWQAMRYTLNACEKLNADTNALDIRKMQLTDFDKWILSRLSNTKRICDEGFENYNFHFAVNAMKTFFYKNLCDVYLVSEVKAMTSNNSFHQQETTKSNIGKGNQEAHGHCAVLITCLSLGLHMMSPFTPFLSQKLLAYIPKHEIFDYDTFMDKKLESEIEDILEVCSAIRQFKSQNNISKKHDPIVHIFPENDDKLLDHYKNYIQTLTLSNGVVLEKPDAKRSSEFDFVSTASHLCSFAIETNQEMKSSNKGNVVNMKKLEKLQSSLQKLLNTISSDGYKRSASETVQRKHLDKIKEIETEINSIRSLK